MGLHLRAASRIVHAAKAFGSEVWIRHNGVQANAKSILGLASLVARYEEEVEVVAEGEDAEAALDALVHLIEVELGREEAS